MMHFIFHWFLFRNYCHNEVVPFYWTDGTITQMHLRICD